MNMRMTLNLMLMKNLLIIFHYLITYLILLMFQNKGVCIKITKVIAFGFPALLVGDEDYILAIPLSEDFNNENIEDIAIALLEYSKERAFPECNSKLVITEDFFSRLSEELKKLNFLDIKNRD